MAKRGKKRDRGDEADEQEPLVSPTGEQELSAKEDLQTADPGIPVESQMQPQIPVQEQQQVMQAPQEISMDINQQNAEALQAQLHAQAQAQHMTDPQMAQMQLRDPAEPPPKKKRRPRAKAKGDDNPHVLVDENGKLIPIPPKHGTPVKHSRPKRQPVPQIKKMGSEEEPNMLIRVHLRRIEGDPEAAQDTLPSATVHAYPSMTLDGLRHKINALCPSLPPRAQHFFRKVEGDHFQRVDSSSRYTKCLRTVGFDEPGPHEIWVEIDLAELYKHHPDDQGMPTDALTPADLAGVSQAHGIHGVVQDPALLTSGEMGEVDENGVPIGGVPDSAPIHHRSINKRSNKKWTEDEVEHLLLGLMKYGTSSWTTIAKTWKFEDRTTVDLKDKWRNLVKNVRDGRVMRGMVLTEEARNRVWRIIHENGIEATPQNQRGGGYAQELITQTPHNEGIPQMDLGHVALQGQEQMQGQEHLQHPGEHMHQNAPEHIPQEQIQHDPQQHVQQEGLQGMAQIEG